MKQNKYSIRKLSIGVASVAIATLFIGGNAVSAEELPVTDNTIVSEFVEDEDIILDESDGLENITEGVSDSSEDKTSENVVKEEFVEELSSEVTSSEDKSFEDTSSKDKSSENTVELKEEGVSEIDTVVAENNTLVAENAQGTVSLTDSATNVTVDLTYNFNTDSNTSKLIYKVTLPDTLNSPVRIGTTVEFEDGTFTNYSSHNIPNGDVRLPDGVIIGTMSGGVFTPNSEYGKYSNKVVTFTVDSVGIPTNVDSRVEKKPYDLPLKLRVGNSSADYKGSSVPGHIITKDRIATAHNSFYYGDRDSTTDGDIYRAYSPMISLRDSKKLNNTFYTIFKAPTLSDGSTAAKDVIASLSLNYLKDNSITNMLSLGNKTKDSVIHAGNKPYKENEFEFSYEVKDNYDVVFKTIYTGEKPIEDVVTGLALPFDVKWLLKDGFVVDKSQSRIRMGIPVINKNDVEGDVLATSNTNTALNLSDVVTAFNGRLSRDEVVEYEDIEFQTIRRPNPNILAGEPDKIIQQGEKGQNKLTYRVVKRDGVIVGGTKTLLDTTKVKDAKDQIVEYGTGEPTVQTIEIPFKVIRRKNANLPKNTPDTIVTPGEKGQWTIKTFNGVEIERTKTKEPVDQIVEFNDEPVIVTRTEPVKFNTIRRKNIKLPAGTPDTLVQQGVNGVKTFTSRNGVWDDGVITVQPKDEIFEYNDDDVITVTTEPIPYNTIRRKNTDLPKNTKDTVIQYGKNGLKRITTTNGVPSEEILTEPKDHIIEYNDEPDIQTRTETVPFKTIRRKNTDLPKNTPDTVIRQGKDGIRTITITNGVSDGGKITTEPIDHIIEYNDDADIKITTEPVPFKTIRRKNLALPKNTPDTVVQKGKDGIRTITITNGVPNEGEISTSPVDHIIEYNDDPAIVVTTEPIPFETIRRKNTNLPKNTGDTVVQPGKDGIRTITVTNGVSDGGVVTTQPVPKIVEYNDDKDIKTVDNEIMFDIIRRRNPNLKPGEIVKVQDGKIGILTITITNGVPDTGKVTVPPQDEIIEYNDDKPTTTINEPVPFETVRRKNPDLKPGETKVVQKGEPGEQVVTKDLDGNILDTKVTKEPVKEIVEYNDEKEPVETKKVRPVPHNVIYKRTDKLLKGEQRVVQEGKDGSKTITLVDGKETGIKVDIEPVDEIIEIGTRRPHGERRVPNSNMDKGIEIVTQEGKDGDDHHEPVDKIIEYGTKVPYKTIYRENPDMEEGEQKVVQEGRNGDHENEPVDEIIEVDTLKPNEVVEEPEEAPTGVSIEAKGSVILPKTGEYSLFIPAVVSILSGLGLVIPTVKRKED